MFKVLLPLLPVLLLISCARPWNDQEKQEFVGGCLSRQSAQMGADSARRFCHCLLDKALARYPDARDAAYMQYDTTSYRMGLECLGRR